MNNGPSAVRFSLRRVALGVLVYGAAVLLSVFLAEWVTRARVMGFRAATETMLTRRSMNDVLGTGDWMISDPVLGYRPNPERPEVNSLGLLNPEIEIAKPADAIRVIVLGDSIVWGSSFVEVLRARGVTSHAGRRIEWINAGVAGYTAYQEVEFYLRDLRRLAPDLVVWSYCLNDHYRFLHTFDPEGHMLFTEELNAPLSRTTLGGRASSWSMLLASIRSLGAKSPPLTVEEQAVKKRLKPAWQGFSRAWLPEAWAEHELQLGRLQQAVEHDRSRLAVIAFPIREQFRGYRDPSESEFLNLPFRRLQDLCVRYRVPFDNLAPLLFAADPSASRVMKDPVHPSAHGHALVADEVQRFVLDLLGDR